MSLKNNQTFPGVRGLACQEWLRSRKLSTCPLTPSSILRQSLGPLEAGENLGGSTVDRASAGQLALFRGPCSGWPLDSDPLLSWLLLCLGRLSLGQGGL